MEWSEDLIARLRGLWDEGLSTAEIGRRLGVSKNAIIGKAHRLSLPGRPSPIRPERAAGTPRLRRAPRRVTGPTLPPLAGAVVVSAIPSGNRRPGAAQLLAPTQREAPKPRAPVFTPSGAPRIGGRPLTCCWPFGEPGTPSFRFCEAPATYGKPYCEEHAQIAYVRVRREDAA